MSRLLIKTYILARLWYKAGFLWKDKQVFKENKTVKFGLK